MQQETKKRANIPLPRPRGCRHLNDLIRNIYRVPKHEPSNSPLKKRLISVIFRPVGGAMLFERRNFRHSPTQLLVFRFSICLAELLIQLFAGSNFYLNEVHEPSIYEEKKSRRLRFAWKGRMMIQRRRTTNQIRDANKSEKDRRKWNAGVTQQGRLQNLLGRRHRHYISRSPLHQSFNPIKNLC